jgi:hypothetical protein
MTDSEPLLPSEKAAMVQTSEPARALFTQIYLGRHNSLDALAWASQPGSRGPSGTLDPRVELQMLRNELYRRPTAEGSTEPNNLADQLEQLTAELEQDDQTLAEALTRALSEQKPATGADRWRRGLAIASPIAAVAFAAIAAFATAAAISLATQPDPSLEVFSRPQTATEKSTEVNAGVDILPGTVRLLGGDSEVQFVAFQTVSSESGTDSLDVCLAVIDGIAASASCTPFDVVSQQGISGTYRGAGNVYTFTWGPTGDLNLSTSREG